MKNVKSAVRVFSILEYFDDVREPRTLTEISRDLDMPMSSCIALLRSLESIDYMTFSPLTKKYLPSGRLQQLGSWLDDFIFSSGTIEKIAESVAKKTGETVIIATMNGLHAQYILRIQSEHPLPYSPVTGSRRPLLKSCAGLVLLAQQKDEFIDRIIIRVNGRAGAMKRDGAKSQKIIHGLKSWGSPVQNAMRGALNNMRPATIAPLKAETKEPNPDIVTATCVLSPRWNAFAVSTLTERTRITVTSRAKFASVRARIKLTSTAPPSPSAPIMRTGT